MEVGSYGVNCSLLSDGRSAWIVDPGSEGERIAETLLGRGLSPAAILLTHAHFDHIGGIQALCGVFPGITVYVGREDAVMFGHPFNQCPPDYPPAEAPENVRDAGELALPGAEVIRTPGHTPGGVCYFFRDFDGAPLLLSGDTLFAGSVGRTDFPGGSMGALMRSLARLKELPEETVVIPGHGPATTIGAEKAGNPYMA